MNKSEYLTARAEWKQAHLELLRAIKANKARLRADSRALSMHGSYVYMLTADASKHNKKVDELSSALGKAKAERRSLMKELMRQLVVLENLKEEAARDFHARKAQKEAAMT